MGAEPARQPPHMNVDEFVAWALDRPGRYELVNGEVVAMAPQRVRHADVKFAVQSALRSAIQAAGLPCHMLPDGMTVRVSKDTAYEPDALIYWGPALPGDAVEVPEPVIVIEVLSPGTTKVDTGEKFSGYFSLPSVRHYLVVNPVNRVCTHHARGVGDLIESRIVASGALRLDPPGLSLEAADFFPDF